VASQRPRPGFERWAARAMVSSGVFVCMWDEKEKGEKYIVVNLNILLCEFCKTVHHSYRYFIKTAINQGLICF
jgi:hypothetical protein